jgi:hypothetical protein
MLRTPPPQNPCDYHTDYRPNEFHRESLPAANLNRYHELRDNVAAILSTDWPLRVKEEKILDYVMSWERS